MEGKTNKIIGPLLELDAIKAPLLELDAIKAPLLELDAIKARVQMEKMIWAAAFAAAFESERCGYAGNSVSSFYCAEIADMAVAKYREAMADDRAKYLDIVREEAGGRAKYLDIVGEEGTK